VAPARALFWESYALARYHLPKDTVCEILGTSAPPFALVLIVAALPLALAGASSLFVSFEGGWEQQAGCSERVGGPGGHYGGWPGC
jgi:hypothetical protein